MRCAVCGGGFSKISATHVGCSTALNKGPTVCANRLTVRRDILEDTALSALRERLMDPEIFKECVAGFTETWNRLQAEAPAGAPIGSEVGTRAGRKTGWTQGDRIAMERNQNYWAARSLGPFSASKSGSSSPTLGLGVGPARKCPRPAAAIASAVPPPAAAGATAAWAKLRLKS